MPELLSKIDAVYGNANRTAEVPMPLKNWIVTDPTPRERTRTSAPDQTAYVAYSGISAWNHQSSNQQVCYRQVWSDCATPNLPV
jgi:hypothetical protein